MTKTLGLDLSLVGSGIVLLENGKIILKQVIKSKPTPGGKPIDELKRIQKIVEAIEDIVSEHSPTIAIIEGMAYMATKTSSLVQLSALNYFTRAMLADYRVPFCLCAPTTLKKFITGKGNADKEVLMMVVYRDYKEQILDNNLVDAFGLALIGTAVLGNPVKKMTIPQEEVIKLIKQQL